MCEYTPNCGLRKDLPIILQPLIFLFIFFVPNVPNHIQLNHKLMTCSLHNVPVGEYDNIKLKTCCKASTFITGRIHGVHHY